MAEQKPPRVDSQNYLLNPNIVQHIFANEQNVEEYFYIIESNHERMNPNPSAYSIPYDNISKNPAITPEIMKRYPNINWCYNGLVQNPNFRMEDLNDPEIKQILINRYPDVFKSTGIFCEDVGIASSMCGNPNITKEQIRQFFQRNEILSPYKLIENKIMDYDFYCELYRTYNNYFTHNNYTYHRAVKQIASTKPNILTLENYMKNPEMWCINGLSANPNITIRDVRANINLIWSVEFLMKNPSITPEEVLELVQDHPEIFQYQNTTPSRLFFLSFANPNITIDYIKKGLDAGYLEQYDPTTIEEYRSIQLLATNPMTHERAAYVTRRKGEIWGDLLGDVCTKYNIRDLRESILAYI